MIIESIEFYETNRYKTLIYHRTAMKYQTRYKGMDCPLPLIELKKALGDAEDGQIIEVEFTCPDAVVNLPGYCEEHNHEVLDFDKQDNKS